MAASAIAYLSSPLASARGSAHASSDPIYFYDNVALLQGLRVRPSQITFNVDGNNTVTDLSWEGWGSPIARGQGTNHVDNCIPNCAQGHVSPVQVHITLSRPGSFHGHDVYRCFAVKPAAKTYLRDSCLP